MCWLFSMLWLPPPQRKSSGQFKSRRLLLKSRREGWSFGSRWSTRLDMATPSTVRTGVFESFVFHFAFQYPDTSILFVYLWMCKMYIFSFEYGNRVIHQLTGFKVYLLILLMQQQIFSELQTNFLFTNKISRTAFFFFFFSFWPSALRQSSSTSTISLSDTFMMKVGWTEDT